MPGVRDFAARASPSFTAARLRYNHFPNTRTDRKASHMRVVIGSDHAGFDQKERIKAHLAEQGHEITDVGAGNADDSVDYPDFAIAAARMVASGGADLGVLVCGTGIGMSIAANKVRGARAANITDVEFAKLAREHNNANIVTVSARFVPVQVNEAILDAFLGTPFGGGRHAGRVAKITAAEG
jgi:ribose 5-phosphate isomerase B